MSLSHVFATRVGLSAFMAYLVFDGAWCMDCHCGTRMTSRAWARCKRCGQRVPRYSSLDAGEAELLACLLRESREAA